MSPPNLLVFLALFLCMLFLYLKSRRRVIRGKKSIKLKGTVVLMKKHALDMTNLRASIVDRIYEVFGRRVSFQLVSATIGDPNDRDIGMTGKPAYIEGWITRIGSMYTDYVEFAVNFNWEPLQGIPGAVVVKNNHRYEFFLRTLTLEGVPGKGRIRFVCNSWVYPADKYSYERIFFVNDTYLPSDTPKTLRPYREDELKVLRGTGAYGKLREHDRVYDYDTYNDIGDPSKGKEYERPALGGSRENPYPRRGRTECPPSNGGTYVPCDEYFRHLKMSDFIAFKLKADKEYAEKIKGEEEFSSFEDVLELYRGPMKMPGFIAKIRDWIPFEVVRELLRTDGERLLSFPLPQVISQDNGKSAWWATDREFARQMLAGQHPVLIRAAQDEEIQEFSKQLERHSKIYQVNGEEVENVDEWVIPIITRNDEEDDCKRFFILDHSYVKKYLEKIYEATSNIAYASKTLLYLEKDGTLTPKGILLTHCIGKEEFVDRYFFQAQDGINGALWKLAKAFVTVNDLDCHQLVSHWLHTHASIEPFVIATNRQLSVMHPIYKLLSPHCRDTMHMNNLGRKIIMQANGPAERNLFTGKFGLILTSEVYKSWNLMEHSLPADLCRRGVAVKEDNKVRLLIEDYPYAVDGLEIWSAIEAWVNEYCSIYYPDDFTVQADGELREWWRELREVGHGDLKDEPWWPKMQTVKELTETCTIIIWLSSAFHAALNFGQYAYSGFIPNRPTFIRRPMPNPGEYEELMKDPDGFFLKTITSKSQALSVMSVLEILSRHSSDEVYLGQRDEAEWTSDQRALDAFNKFHNELVVIEKNIEMRNQDEKLKNRHGQIQVPYTLLFPNTSDYDHVAGLTGRGIPNSVSI